MIPSPPDEFKQIGSVKLRPMRILCIYDGFSSAEGSVITKYKRISGIAERSRAYNEAIKSGMDPDAVRQIEVWKKKSQDLKQKSRKAKKTGNNSEAMELARQIMGLEQKIMKTELAEMEKGQVKGKQFAGDRDIKIHISINKKLTFMKSGLPEKKPEEIQDMRAARIYSLMNRKNENEFKTYIFLGKNWTGQYIKSGKNTYLMKSPYKDKNTMLVKSILIEITAHEDRTQKIIKELNLSALDALIHQ
ncbi:MAG: hypothetical protein OEZ34_05090 [Spirochaetia bacterium]|nr:hypothetical protein [Spirochaetia bacterium]